MLTTVNSSHHIEQLVYSVVSEGHYRCHPRRLADRVARATDAAVPRLLANGRTLFCEPTGGYSVFLQLPLQTNDIALAREAAREGIFIAPGSVCSPDQHSARRGIRVNVAHAQDPRFYDFLSRAKVG